MTHFSQIEQTIWVIKKIIWQYRLNEAVITAIKASHSVHADDSKIKITAVTVKKQQIYEQQKLK